MERYPVVEPSPPVPIWVFLAIFISTTSGMAAFSIITYAMALPCSKVCPVLELFLNKTPMLPLQSGSTTPPSTVIPYLKARLDLLAIRM